VLTLNPIPTALKTLTRDGWLLFLTRFVRLFAYGSLSVVLVFYLIGLLSISLLAPIESDGGACLLLAPF